MQLAENKHIKSQLKLKDQFKLSPAFDETITEEEVDQGVQSMKNIIDTLFLSFVIGALSLFFKFLCS